MAIVFIILVLVGSLAATPDNTDLHNTPRSVATSSVYSIAERSPGRTLDQMELYYTNGRGLRFFRKYVSRQIPSCNVDSKRIHGCEVKINIDPKKTIALGLDTTVTISCDVESYVKELLQISLSKGDEEPFVIMGQGSGNITYGTKNVMHYQAEGDIDVNAVRNYLNVKLIQPTHEDSGLYSCVVLYLDTSLIIRQSRASSDLVVEANLDNSKLENVLSILVARVSNLEKDRRNLRHQMAKLSKTAGDMWAFSATSTNSNVTEGNILLFPELTMQVGHVYNVSDGIFTAPADGLYLFHLTVTEVNTPLTCDEGWTFYPGAATCVKVFEVKKTWQNARTSCKKYDGDLVKIPDEDFTQFLKEIHQPEHVWMGAKRINNGQFSWLDEDRQITYSRWSSEEPNNAGGDENCAMLYNNHFWNDVSCGVELHYMCQKSATVPDCRNGVHLMANNKVLAKLQTYDVKDSDTTHVSYLITLKAGEKISPTLTNGHCDLFTSQPTVFTGVLITAF